VARCLQRRSIGLGGKVRAATRENSTGGPPCIVAQVTRSSAPHHSPPCPTPLASTWRKVRRSGSFTFFSRARRRLTCPAAAAADAITTKPRRCQRRRMRPGEMSVGGRGPGASYEDDDCATLAPAGGAPAATRAGREWPAAPWRSTMGAGRWGVAETRTRSGLNSQLPTLLGASSGEPRQKPLPADRARRATP